MIVIKVELHSARTGQISELGRMYISNTGHLTSKNPNRGDYIVELFRKGSTTKVQRKGLVCDYPRNSYTVWELVRRALECTLGKWPIHPGRPEEFNEDVMGASNGFMVSEDTHPGVVTEEFKDKLRALGNTSTKAVSEHTY